MVNVYTGKFFEGPEATGPSDLEIRILKSMSAQALADAISAKIENIKDDKEKVEVWRWSHLCDIEAHRRRDEHSPKARDLAKKAVNAAEVKVSEWLQSRAEITRQYREAHGALLAKKRWQEASDLSKENYERFHLLNLREHNRNEIAKVVSSELGETELVWIGTRKSSWENVDVWQIGAWLLEIGNSSNYNATSVEGCIRIERWTCPHLQAAGLGKVWEGTGGLAYPL